MWVGLSDGLFLSVWGRGSGKFSFVPLVDPQRAGRLFKSVSPYLTV